MPESLRTTKDAPPLVAPTTIRSASPLERTYPEMAGFGPIYVMSIAPANRASMAEGPALKLFHSIFTCGPMALANQSLLLPTIACGCVMLGNAPTRITSSARAKVSTKPTRANKRDTEAEMTPLFIGYSPALANSGTMVADSAFFFFPVFRFVRLIALGRMSPEG